MASARIKDEDAEMDTLTPDGATTNNRRATVYNLSVWKRILAQPSGGKRGHSTQRTLLMHLQETPIKWM